MQHDYRHGRTIDKTSAQELRLPGDRIFISLGALPLVVASFKDWLTGCAWRLQSSASEWRQCMKNPRR
jgi:hypothetical protein